MPATRRSLRRYFRWDAASDEVADVGTLPPFPELRILKDLAEGCLEVRILKELQSHFFAKNAEVLDLRKIKELAYELDVQIPRYKVARVGYIVKYFIIPLSI